MCSLQICRLTVVNRSSNEERYLNRVTVLHKYVLHGKLERALLSGDYFSPRLAGLPQAQAIEWFSGRIAAFTDITWCGSSLGV